MRARSLSRPMGARLSGGPASPARPTRGSMGAAENSFTSMEQIDRWPSSDKGRGPSERSMGWCRDIFKNRGLGEIGDGWRQGKRRRFGDVRVLAVPVGIVRSVWNTHELASSAMHLSAITTADIP